MNGWVSEGWALDCLAMIFREKTKKNATSDFWQQSQKKNECEPRVLFGGRGFSVVFFYVPENGPRRNLHPHELLQ